MRSVVPIRALKPFKVVGSERRCVHVQLDGIIHHRNVLFKETNKAEGDCEDVHISAGMFVQQLAQRERCRRVDEMKNTNYFNFLEEGN